MSIFEYHNPTDDMVSQIHVIRGAFMRCEEAIRLHVPPSPERTLCIRRLQEASFWANHAITHEGEVVG